MKTSNFPLVNVHVLSNTTVFIFLALSITSLFLINNHFLANIQLLTTDTKGTANHNAHGHATTRTVIAWIKESWIQSQIINLTNKVIIAILIMIGTKYQLILSAIFWILVFQFVAWITILTIHDIIESFQIFFAWYSTYPS